MHNKLVYFLLFLFSFLHVQSQNKFYTLIQGGANIGFANEGYKGTFSGYSTSLIFGKNYNDRAYLGLGIGSERLKGEYEKLEGNKKISTEIVSAEYTQDLMPIFIDARLPIGEFSTFSKLGILANAGYAPSVGVRYDRGFLFRTGFFYLFDNPQGLAWTLSGAYAYQELTRNRIDLGKHFQHQQFNISIGILLK